jgi:hypothetical protein
MHDIQSPRRRRNQPEIDQLVREFRDSGLNRKRAVVNMVPNPM